MKSSIFFFCFILVLQVSLGQNIQNQEVNNTKPIVQDSFQASDTLLVKAQPCDAPNEIMCGESPYQGSTAYWYSTSNFFANSFYTCANFGPTAYDAPDELYKFTLTNTVQITISLEILTPNADLDLFLLSSCQPAACIASSTTTSNLESIQIELAAGDYYIVVDGYEGWTGQYTIRLSCNCSAIDLTCNQPVLAESTIGQINKYNTSSYSICGNGFNPGDYNGPDKLYKITVANPTHVDISMDI
ncbi:MAG TPA: PPC domain-containing protein, partial [Saprospiraceae bacterium]|nr:PPC domain-containing protein [Saprospiraceae bacterium]